MFIAKESILARAAALNAAKHARPVTPALGDWILNRDGFQCRAPGCGRRDNLGVYHIDPNLSKSRHDPKNLVTLCATCQPFWDLMGRGPFYQEKTNEVVQERESSGNQLR